MSVLASHIFNSTPTASQQNYSNPAITTNGGIELGMKFTSDVAGTITGVRFYKGVNNTGPHVGNLWDASGNLLASAVFTNETASGWQKALFAAPVSISAKTTYVISYHTTAASISYYANRFKSEGASNSQLHVLQNGVNGPNGVYAYGPTSSFPNVDSGQSAFYWVDVVFSTAAQVVPQWPDDVTYSPDYIACVSPDGSDTTGNGSVSSPFASGQAAWNAVQQAKSSANPPKLPAIAYRADGTYVQELGLSGPILVTSYGAATVEQRPVIMTPPDTSASAFTVINTNDIHFQNLRVVSDPNTQGAYGFYLNGIGSSLTFDYCEIEGFGIMGVAVLGAENFRFHHNYVARTGPETPTTESGSGIFTEGVQNPDVQCNIFYHCGWNEAYFNMADSAWVEAAMFRHGWYEGAYFSATSGTNCFNIFIDNCATGHQGRNGGLTQWCVFQSNGAATDAFLEAGWNNDQNGEFANLAVFGATSQDFAFWGGGLTGMSVNLSIHDIVFSGNNTMSTCPPIILAWTANAYVPPPYPAIPASATANVFNISGVWNTLGTLNSAVYVDPTRGSTKVTCENINVRQANPGEVTLSINDFLGTANDEASAQLLRTNLHNPKYGAQEIVLWARKNVK